LKKSARKWIAESDSEKMSMMGEWSWLSPPLQTVSEPLNPQGLACCVVAAGCAESETVALALFRVAQTHMQSRQFIDVIRLSYLCLEHMFAHGKSSRMRKN
jgi:hypothetical protein